MKERLDVLLVNNGLAETREMAKRTIMAGLVTVDGRLEDKPGSRFDIDSDVQVKGQDLVLIKPFFKPQGAQDLSDLALAFDVVFSRHVLDQLLGDPTKAKTLLGWDPRKTPVEEMVRIMVEHDLEYVKTH